MNIWDYLPAFPWEGPPLPRIMAVNWPWMNAPLATPVASSFSNPLRNLFNGMTEKQSPPPPQITPDTTPAYENLEEIELQDIDPELLMPRKIVVHRKYKKRVE
jgi:hypothetical protein